MGRIRERLGRDKNNPSHAGWPLYKGVSEEYVRDGPKNAQRYIKDRKIPHVLPPPNSRTWGVFVGMPSNTYSDA